MVRGTTHGAYADQYRLLIHFDEREIILNGLQAQRSGFDVYALGKPLDPGVVALRGRRWTSQSSCRWRSPAR